MSPGSCGPSRPVQEREPDRDTAVSGGRSLVAGGSEGVCGGSDGGNVSFSARGEEGSLRVFRVASAETEAVLMWLHFGQRHFFPVSGEGIARTVPQLGQDWLIIWVPLQPVSPAAALA